MGGYTFPLTGLIGMTGMGGGGVGLLSLMGGTIGFTGTLTQDKKCFVRNFHPKSTIATNHLKFTICIQIESWLKTHFSLVFRLAKALGS